jgi:hypothetical protein
MFEDDIHPFSWPLWVVIIPLGLMSMCTQENGDAERKADELKRLLCSEEVHKHKKECQ